MANRVIEKEQLTAPYLVPNLLTGASVGTWQEDYPLREVEFERIINGRPLTFFWANSLVLTSLGFGLSLIAKGYSDVSAIKKGEWLALGIGGVVSLCLYLAGAILPNQRRKVIKRIKKHFKKAPISREAFRGDQQ